MTGLNKFNVSAMFAFLTSLSSIIYYKFMSLGKFEKLILPREVSWHGYLSRTIIFDF